MKAHEGLDANVPIFAAMALERVGWLALCSVVFTLEEPWYSYYRRLSRP